MRTAWTRREHDWQRRGRRWAPVGPLSFQGVSNTRSGLVVPPFRPWFRRNIGRQMSPSGKEKQSRRPAAGEKLPRSLGPNVQIAADGTMTTSRGPRAHCVWPQRPRRPGRRTTIPSAIRFAFRAPPAWREGLHYRSEKSPRRLAHCVEVCKKAGSKDESGARVDDRAIGSRVRSLMAHRSVGVIIKYNERAFFCEKWQAGDSGAISHPKPPGGLPKKRAADRRQYRRSDFVSSDIVEPGAL